MTGFDTSRVLNIEQFFTFSFYTLLLVALAGCTYKGKNSERPSPYAYDSLTLPYTTLQIAYSSPRVRSREIWGTKLVPYDKVWRTGANEASVFTTSDSISFANETLPPGKYALFIIPNPDKWTIILNKEWSQWGAYDYDKKQDLVRIDVTPQKTAQLKEEMTMRFAQNKLIFEWEYVTFSIPIQSVD